MLADIPGRPGARRLTTTNYQTVEVLNTIARKAACTCDVLTYVERSWPERIVGIADRRPVRA